MKTYNVTSDGKTLIESETFTREKEYDKEDLDTTILRLQNIRKKFDK